MADNKQDQDKQPTPKPGDIKPAFGAGVQNDADKADADKSSPKNGGQGFDGPVQRPDETIPGGAYIVDGVVRDANGNERKDYKVEDGKIVPAE